MAELERSPYNRLLDDPDFKRWFRNAERGSQSFAYELLRRMGYVERRFGKSPKQLAELTPKQAANFILDVVSSLEGEKLAGTYILNYVKALKNWFEYNDIHVTQRIKVKATEGKYADERPPTQVELRRIFEMADFRTKVACSIVAFSGARLEVLGTYLGDDGLKVRDFPEMIMKRKKVEFDKIPSMVVVRKGLSKTGAQYFSFLPREGCDYLKQYLEWRMREGEELGPDSPILTPSLFHKRLIGNHIRTTNISDLMRKSIRTAGFQWRPYVLRRYFDTRLMIAETDGMIIRDWRVFWMGHVGDIEAVYTVNKGLSKDIIEKMRESYSKAAEKHLTTSRREEEMTKSTVIETFNRQFLSMAGFSEAEISKLGDLSQLAPQQIQDLIQRKSMHALGLNGNGKQKIVPLSEVRTWVIEGWEYVSTLPTNEAVVRLPSP